MDNAAKTEHPILDVIARRWSPRAFDRREPTQDELSPILEAARWAASSYNEQPWRFILVPRSAGSRYEDALAGLNEFNRSWAASAPVLGFSLARRNFTQTGAPNTHAWYDTGAATALMSVQAAAIGLMMHQMAGIEREVVRERFGVGEDFDVVAGLALGWPGDPASLPEGLRERETATRLRKPFAEMVHPEPGGEG
ncbi:nitroreductase family protein [Pseudenhygromyxa sp. WMMC2535]|uniref:nitroreductase family protein n=1 Tax=Pseudenhygromyxa sp. WMMC2535 TaxID=2712867 RepID=UPI0015523ADC|nr:nitroreductase family protein [Pseudenhygromyxa sp. WMMC2535]NVB42902.1 nitroreductase family protein [Pseudenhygromyxa sp. WMMC2535]